MLLLRAGHFKKVLQGKKFGLDTFKLANNELGNIELIYKFFPRFSEPSNWRELHKPPLF